LPLDDAADIVSIKTRGVRRIDARKPQACRQCEPTQRMLPPICDSMSGSAGA
jgi:hypothetical protein